MQKNKNKQNNKLNHGPSNYLQSQLLLASKKYLTTEEAAVYLGLSKHSIYKLTRQRIVPIYKPGGKNIYIKREDLDEWVLNSRIKFF